MSNWDKALIGTSRSFLQVTGMIPMLSMSKSTVLISGETGTGKELFARAIHYSGERRGKPFVPVNCAALPDLLIENELFGHSKGAFTGALIEKPGLFHEADGGTLFLDEINSLSMTVQSKLLRVLARSRVQAVGLDEKPKGRCEDPCCDQSGLALLGRNSPIPGGSLPPAECIVCCPATVARPEGGYSSAGAPLLEGLRERIRQGGDDARTFSQGEADGLCLARQRKRIAMCNSACRGDRIGRAARSPGS